MGSAPTFTSMEWSGWSTLRHAFGVRRTRAGVVSPPYGELEHSLSAARSVACDGPIDITDQRIWLNGLPESFRGFRILQLSDIHHSRYFPLDRVARMVELSNRLQPDLVAL